MKVAINGNLTTIKAEVALPIKTSLASEVKYCPETRVLTVNFSTHPEDVYQFYNIDENTMRSMIESPSFGRYFKQHIENNYTTYKNGILLTKRD